MPFLEKDERNRYLIAEGKYAGEFLDDVASEEPKVLHKAIVREDLSTTERNIIGKALAEVWRG